jgi:hypothetical protein
MQEEQQERQQGAETLSNQAESSRPPCCGSGCAVCVLDYWPDYREDERLVVGLGAETIDSEILLLLPMLEAFEEAQQKAGQLVAPTDDDLR